MHPRCYFTVNAIVVIFCSISIIIPCCVFVLVALPERIWYPAEVRAPTTVAKTRIAISETRPQFGKRILEERRPVTHTHVNDDWFVLLDVGPKESGIFLTCLCWFFVVVQTNSSLVVALSSLHETLLQPVKSIRPILFTKEYLSTDGSAQSLLFNDLQPCYVSQIEEVALS